MVTERVLKHGGWTSSPSWTRATSSLNLSRRPAPPYLKACKRPHGAQPPEPGDPLSDQDVQDDGLPVLPDEAAAANSAAEAPEATFKKGAHAVLEILNMRIFRIAQVCKRVQRL